ncbi:hypothetical protein SLEP1_g50226 [Rubroshorea leprosula]|uniref:Uncharacterized protein n=1 Tax=Rubroshorea leprosula TaxID=152421 RepID=A0AAV5LZB6_9ROSI|nr:hypothetical protein SLEP1_g50226 [Rubroshorea leprosula]
MDLEELEERIQETLIRNSILEERRLLDKEASFSLVGEGEKMTVEVEKTLGLDGEAKMVANSIAESKEGVGCSHPTMMIDTVHKESMNEADLPMENGDKKVGNEEMLEADRASSNGPYMSPFGLSYNEPTRVTSSGPNNVKSSPN